DRSQAGQATLVDGRGTRVAGPFAAYGKADPSDAAAHDNQSCDPLRLFGNTPCGHYKFVIAVPTGRGTPYSESAYGPLGAIVLEPVAGDALLAAANGRRGLMIHGGTPGAGEALRATNGCIRLSNNDMAALLRSMARLLTDRQPLLCCVA